MPPCTRPWNTFTWPRNSITNCVAGLVEHFFRRADLLDPAVVHHDDAVGHFERFFLIVRHQDAGDVNLVVQPAEPGPQALPHLGVERAERLVEQQHFGLDGQRPGQRGPLPLAAGELRREPPAEAVELHQRQQLVHAAIDFRFRRPGGTRAHAQAERHVFEHAHVAEQRVMLKHEADAPLGRGAMGDVLVVEPDSRARVALRRFQAGDDPQQRRLARAAGAQQRDQLAVVDRQADVAQRLVAAERLADV